MVLDPSQQEMANPKIIKTKTTRYGFLTLRPCQIDPCASRTKDKAFISFVTIRTQDYNSSYAFGSFQEKRLLSGQPFDDKPFRFIGKIWI